MHHDEGKDEAENGIVLRIPENKITPSAQLGNHLVNEAVRRSVTDQQEFIVNQVSELIQLVQECREGQRMSRLAENFYTAKVAAVQKGEFTFFPNSPVMQMNDEVLNFGRFGAAYGRFPKECERRFSVDL
jgi:hypothetical protein